MRVQEQQKPIATWMKSVVARRGITASDWAKRAGLGRNTVSRAMREDYPHITSTTTLLRLANVVGDRPPIHSGPAPLPSEDMLTDILATILLVAVPDRPVSLVVTLALAGALRDTLGLLANDAAVAADPAQARLVARTTALLQFAPGAA